MAREETSAEKRQRHGAGQAGAWRTCARRSGALLALTLLLFARAAASQGATAEDRRAALYREGVALADAGRWAEAVERFRQVVALRSAPPALFTLGQALEHVGHLAGAESSYEHALADARDGDNADVSRAAERAIAALHPRVPRITVRLADGGETGARATLDGEPVLLDVDVPADPGEHRVVVRGTGNAAFDRAVRLVEGQSLELLVAWPAPLAVPQARGGGVASGEPSAPRRGPSLIGPALLAGVGVALGATGLVVEAIGRSDYSTVISNPGCSGGAATCTSRALVDAGNDARERVIVGTAVLAVGVAALTGAGVWWALGRSAGSPRRAPVAVGVGGTGVAIAGRF